MSWLILAITSSLWTAVGQPCPPALSRVVALYLTGRVTAAGIEMEVGLLVVLAYTLIFSVMFAP